MDKNITKYLGLGRKESDSGNKDGNKIRKREWGICGWQERGAPCTGPNLIRNIIREIVSCVSVSWEMAGYPPLPWEYSGIIGDFTHWHLFFNFLQMMSESEPAAAPPHKNKYFIIIKDIFLSSFKDFSFDRTQCSLLFFQLISDPKQRGMRGGMETNIRFQRHKEIEYSPAGDVTRDMWRSLMTVTSHSSHSWQGLDTVTPPSSQHLAPGRGMQLHDQ